MLKSTIRTFAFSFSFFFFFFLKHVSALKNISMGLVHCLRDSQSFFLSNFFIKNWSHDTIHTFKNYFTTIFLVFIKISVIQTDSKNDFVVVEEGSGPKIQERGNQSGDGLKPSSNGERGNGVRGGYNSLYPQHKVVLSICGIVF